MKNKIEIKKWETKTVGLKSISREVTKDAKEYGVIIKVTKIKKVKKLKDGYTLYNVYHRHTGGYFRI
jgi:hypothetical protein